VKHRVVIAALLIAACRPAAPTLAPCSNAQQCPGEVCLGTLGAALCRPLTCADGRANGFETDVDCGGPHCPACAAQKVCLADGDCASGQCTVNHCDAVSCSDGVQNQRETDVDCGGGSCPRCPAGLRCGLSADCADGACVGGVCAAPSCTDNQRNGLETDVDCGGGCAPCGPGGQCVVNADCGSGACVDGHCGDLCGPPLLACSGAWATASIRRASSSSGDTFKP